jgi:hypothetical protein
MALSGSPGGALARQTKTARRPAGFGVNPHTVIWLGTDNGA